MNRPVLVLSLVIIGAVGAGIVLQQRVVAKASSAKAAAIPGLLLSEIPVERNFSFSLPVHSFPQQSPISPITFPVVGASVYAFESELPGDVGLLLTHTRFSRTSSPSLGLRYCILANGTPVFTGNGGADDAQGPNDIQDPIVIPPGATLRIEVAIDSGSNAFAMLNLQGKYLQAGELTLP